MTTTDQLLLLIARIVLDGFEMVLHNQTRCGESGGMYVGMPPGYLVQLDAIDNEAKLREVNRG